MFILCVCFECVHAPAHMPYALVHMWNSEDCRPRADSVETVESDIYCHDSFLALPRPRPFPK